MYNPDLLYVTANLEETRLRGVAPGNPVELQVDAFAEPFRGRVVWINKSTGAQFALMPRNVVCRRVHQGRAARAGAHRRLRRTSAGRDLRAGLSVRAVISHGEGDARWAEQAAREMADTRDALQPSEGVTRMSQTHDNFSPARRRLRLALAQLGIIALAGGGGRRPHLGHGLPDAGPDRCDRRRDPQGHRRRALQHDLDQRELGGHASSTGCSPASGRWPASAPDTLLVGLAWFALGNLLCGAAIDVSTLAGAKLVEGVGKGMVIVICRSLLYRQFDRMVIVAIGFYGVIAYATRPTTPLLTALVNDALSWRWVFWVNVPLALLAIPAGPALHQARPPAPAAAVCGSTGLLSPCS